MRRRDFIMLFGGAAVWPLAARAQQAERVRRIGVLLSTTETDPEGQARVAALRQGLEELGWTERRNIKVDYRWGAGDPLRVRAHAAELVASKPDVIIASPSSVVAAVQRETLTIPVVFATGRVEVISFATDAALTLQAIAATGRRMSSLTSLDSRSL